MTGERRIGHDAPATRAFRGMSAAEASEVGVRTRPSDQVGGDVPAHEVWRQRIADGLRASGRVRGDGRPASGESGSSP